LDVAGKMLSPTQVLGGGGVGMMTMPASVDTPGGNDASVGGGVEQLGAHGSAQAPASPAKNLRPVLLTTMRSLSQVPHCPDASHRVRPMAQVTSFPSVDLM
jgi:hypothetical protein